MKRYVIDDTGSRTWYDGVIFFGIIHIPWKPIDKLIYKNKKFFDKYCGLFYAEVYGEESYIAKYTIISILITSFIIWIIPFNFSEIQKFSIFAIELFIAYLFWEFLQFMSLAEDYDETHEYDYLDWWYE